LAERNARIHLVLLDLGEEMDAATASAEGAGDISNATDTSTDGAELKAAVDLLPGTATGGEGNGADAGNSSSTAGASDVELLAGILSPLGTGATGPTAGADSTGGTGATGGDTGPGPFANNGTRAPDSKFETTVSGDVELGGYSVEDFGVPAKNAFRAATAVTLGIDEDKVTVTDVKQAGEEEAKGKGDSGGEALGAEDTPEVFLQRDLGSASASASGEVQEDGMSSVVVTYACRFDDEAKADDVMEAIEDVKSSGGAEFVEQLKESGLRALLTAKVSEPSKVTKSKDDQGNKGDDIWCNIGKDHSLCGEMKADVGAELHDHYGADGNPPVIDPDDSDNDIIGGLGGLPQKQLGKSGTGQPLQSLL
jgi:hypothetical protein